MRAELTSLIGSLYLCDNFDGPLSPAAETSWGPEMILIASRNALALV